MTNIYYTGVGSRETPTEIMEIMSMGAYKLASYGFIGRSGSATGADTAFEIGHDLFSQDTGIVRFESFLPWDGFNGHTNDDVHIVAPGLSLYHEAKLIMSSVHPKYNGLSPIAKKLHTRNVFQVLGTNLSSPSSLLVCWAKPRGVYSVHGGTNTAYQLALRNNATILNLYEKSHLDRFMNEFNI